jgi:hypothetical protein
VAFKGTDELFMPKQSVQRTAAAILVFWSWLLLSAASAAELDRSTTSIIRSVGREST